MPEIHPTGWREVASTGAAAREIETLALFADSLPDAYCVYHGVHWTNIERGFSVYGEIDFILVAPNGRLLLIEQKSGFLDETAEGLVKTYSGKSKNVEAQIMRAISGLMTRFGKGPNQLPLSIDYLLYCPDYRVKNPHTAGIDAAHIIDSSNRDKLVAVVQRLLPITDETPQLARVKHFLGDILSLTPDPSSMIGRAEQMVTRLSGGLAAWGRRLDFDPFRLRVIGTAGSGKTQLALAEYNDAIAQGLTPFYICYNRPLADHLQHLVPAGGRVGTFHMVCDTYAREQGLTLNYTSPKVFDEMEAILRDGVIPPAWQCDVLIIDEGQDFSEAWRDLVLRLLKSGGRAIWLEDPMQNLYGREPVALPGWVTLRSNANYRSPRQVVDLLASITKVETAIEAASPFLGADIDTLTYPAGDIARMFEATKQAITQCLGANFRRQDIALISFKGREKSALLHLDTLGPHSLRSFTGDYDLLGCPIFREGGLLAESVYRFKGQSAPAVIFTEIDFEELDVRTVRKLFVGITRARLKLILVLSERSAAAPMAEI